MPPNQNELQSLLSIISNYLGKFLSTTGVSKPLRKLISLWYKMDMEQYIANPILQSQEHNEEEWKCGFLQWKGEIIPDIITIQMDMEQQFQNLYDKAKNIIKNESMAFYNEKEKLYLEPDASDVGLGASIQQEWGMGSSS